MGTPAAAVESERVSLGERLLGDLERLPGQRPVLVRVSQLADDPATSSAELADACAADPVFTARLLQVANSAHYARPAPVSTLVAALTLVGRSTVRGMALSLCLGLSGEQGLLPPGFSERAAITGAAAQAVAPLVGADAGDALVAGLLAELGQALLFRAAPYTYRRLLEDLPPEELLAAEREWCGTDHAALGSLALGRAGLPEGLCAAVAAHHSPGGAAGQAPLVRALRAGVVLADTVSGEEPEREERLSRLPSLTGGALDEAGGARLTLSIAAAAAALSRALH